MHKMTSAKFNQSFQTDETGLKIIEENLTMLGIRDKSKMYRRALERMNEELKASQGATA